MRNISKVEVYFHSRKVGTIAEYRKYLTAFEYDTEWIECGFSISPFSLPLRKKLFISKAEPFAGLHGVFSDHLPDGWGRLLIDRHLKQAGEEPQALTELSRLTLISSDSFGGLEFRPSAFSGGITAAADFDKLYEDVQKLLSASETVSELDKVLLSGGSSGGARPKVNVEIEGDLYLVKFPGSADERNISVMEYDYLECAAECGIEVPEHRLLESRSTPGFLAVKRFDRPHRPHMISLCGLLETSHRTPALDYSHILRSVEILTHSQAEIERVFRLMCFNIFSGNMDDHGKNFTLMHTDRGWKLAPAYDLTYSPYPYGERATTVNGKGKNITLDDIVSYSEKFSLDRKKLSLIADEIKCKVEERLGVYLKKE